MTLSSTNSVIWWYGGWEHPACGASGETNWPDESVPHADHECDQADAGDVTWSGEWTCEGCGAGGDARWTDTESTYSDRTCDNHNHRADHDDDQEAVA